MATANLSSFSWKGQYSSSSGYLWNQNCYCNPAEVYFWCPSVAGQTTGRTIEVHVPIVYNNKSIPCYAKLTVNGSTYYNSWPQYCTPNASGINLSIKFYNVTIPSGGASATVNIDFGDYNAVQLYSSLWSPYGYMDYTAITACGAPSSISFTDKRLIPGNSYSVSWGAGSAGIANNISGYICQYRYGSNNWTTLYNGTGTSTSFTPSPDYRGQKVQFQVQTKGDAGENWYSGFYTNGKSYLVNTLPSAPSVTLSQSTVSVNGGSVTLTASASSDSDSDSTSVYYSTSTNGNKTLYTKALTPTIKTETTYYFWTWDEYEFSSSCAEKTIKINTPPKITSLGLKYTSLIGNNSSRIYIRGISSDSPTVVSSSLDISYEWFIKYDDQNITFSEDRVFSLSLDNSTYWGKTIQIGLKVGDGLDTTTLWSGQFFVPHRLSSAKEPTITVKRYLDGDSLDESTGFTYFGSKLSLKWANPSLGGDYLKTSSYYRITNTETGSSSSSTHSTAAEGDSTVDLSFLVNYGEKVKIELIREEVSTQATQVSKTITIIRAIQPTFSSQTFKIQDGVTLYPLSGRIGESTGKLIANFSSASCSEGDLNWTLTADFAGYTKTLSTMVANDTSGLKCEVDSNIWRSAFYGTDAKTAKAVELNNKNYSVKYTITCRDKFGNTNSITTTNRSLSYQETPSWGDSSLLDLQICYTDSVIGGSLSGDKADDYNKLMHKDEKLKISWGTYQDLNEDPELKVIISAKGDNNISTQIWEGPASVKNATLSLTSLSTDVNYKFSAYLKTSVELKSKEIITKNAITYCRATNPTLKINSTTVNASTTEIKIEVTDLGGSKITSPKNLNYDRGSTQNPHNDINSYFSNPNKPVFKLLQSLDGVTWDEGISANDNEIFISTFTEENLEANLTFNLIKPKEITFFKVRLIISTGLNGQQVVGETSVVSTFPDNPTVSHRKYQVGINTNEFDTTDILHISAQTGKNILRLTGATSSGSLTEIKLDLSSLALSASGCLNLQSPLNHLTIKKDNPYIAFIDIGSSNDGYERQIQVYNNQIGIGTGWEKSIKVDNNGNLTVVGAIDRATIDGGTW